MCVTLRVILNNMTNERTNTDKDLGCKLSDERRENFTKELKVVIQITGITKELLKSTKFQKQARL
jgi:hypothetical protein